MKVVAAVVSACLCLLNAAGAEAQDRYPARQMRLIVPFVAGGPGDIVGRLLASRLADGLGQPVMVENRPGAAGTIGTAAAANAAADGHVLVLGSTGTLVAAPHLLANAGYDPARSFTPVSLVIRAPFLVVVHASVTANSLAEFIAAARAQPGRFNFGSGGNGNPLHIAGEMFKLAAGVDLLHVPYKGAAPALTDLLAGRIQAMFEQSAVFQPHFASGAVKALAVAGPRRLPNLPGVPTTAEAGLPGYQVSVWFGLLGPAGMPAEVTRRLNAEVHKALGEREAREQLTKLGFDAGGSTPEALAALIRDDGVVWAAAIRASGAKPD
jgi:tripartite-type tricarboxylate transporter receptor subunit TctC